MSLLTEAIKAYTAMKAAEEENKKQDWIQETSKVLSHLKRSDAMWEPAEIDVDARCVFIDDLRFHMYLDDETDHPIVRLLGSCPTCHQETESRDILTIEGLGMMLVSFEPSYFHICPMIPKEVRTVSERLEALIREIVRDEIGVL